MILGISYLAKFFLLIGTVLSLIWRNYFIVKCDKRDENGADGLLSQLLNRY